MMQQLHAVVHGRVQGVSFRYYTVLKARQLGLVGWVLNRPDGTVEATAEGEKELLDAFLEFLHEGPPAAHVTRVEEHWYAPGGSYSDFDVRYGHG